MGLTSSKIWIAALIIYQSSPLLVYSEVHPMEFNGVYSEASMHRISTPL